MTETRPQSYEDAVLLLNARYSLAHTVPVTEQDWAFCNSDCVRISEFQSIFEQDIVTWLVGEDAWESELVGDWLDLILESANQALQQGALATSDLFSLRSFLLRHKALFNTRLGYWLTIAETEKNEPTPAFPVARRLQSWGIDRAEIVS